MENIKYLRLPKITRLEEHSGKTRCYVRITSVKIHPSQQTVLFTLKRKGRVKHYSVNLAKAALKDDTLFVSRHDMESIITTS